MIYFVLEYNLFSNDKRQHSQVSEQPPRLRTARIPAHMVQSNMVPDVLLVRLLVPARGHSHRHERHHHQDHTQILAHLAPLRTLQHEEDAQAQGERPRAHLLVRLLPHLHSARANLHPIHRYPLPTRLS